MSKKIPYFLLLRRASIYLNSEMAFLLFSHNTLGIPESNQPYLRVSSNGFGAQLVAQQWSWRHHEINGQDFFLMMKLRALHIKKDFRWIRSAFCLLEKIRTTLRHLVLRFFWHIGLCRLLRKCRAGHHHLMWVQQSTAHILVQGSVLS